MNGGIDIKVAEAMDPLVASKDLLTKQERTCLFLAAQGKTSKEIAQLLSIKKNTVDGYKKLILKKLQAQNISNAVFKGIHFGCISINDNQQDII